MNVRAAALLGCWLPWLLAGCATDQAGDVDLWRRELLLGEPIPFEPGQPLSLTEAVRLANDRNERLGVEGETYLQAMIERSRINATFLPEIAFTPDYTFRDRTTEGIPFLDDPRLLDVPIHGQVNLFDGFRDKNRSSAQALTIEQHRALLLDLRETIVLEVVQAYYRVLRAERRTGVLLGSLAVQQQRVRETTARQRIGTARALDVSQTEAQASRTSLDLIDARNDIVAGRAALTLLTGADVGASPLSDAFALPDERPTVDALLALGELRRQDLRAAALAAEAARVRVEVAFGQYYPSVGVSLDYFMARESLPTTRDWTGLLSLYLPLFSGGRIAADVRTAWSEFRQEVQRYWQLRRQIRHDLVVAQDQLRALDERIVELQKLVAADQAAMRQAEVSFQFGLGTNLDRIQAQDALLRGQIDVAEAELQRKVAWLLELRLTGALTAGTVDVPVPPPPPPRPAPESPFVRNAGAASVP